MGSLLTFDAAALALPPEYRGLALVLLESSQEVGLFAFCALHSAAARNRETKNGRNMRAVGCADGGERLR